MDIWEKDGIIYRVNFDDILNIFENFKGNKENSVWIIDNKSRVNIREIVYQDIVNYVKEVDMLFGRPIIYKNNLGKIELKEI